jgi:hypothetical protein
MTPIRGRGRQELRSPVHDERYALPGIGVCTRRFEGRYTWSGPQVLDTTFFAYRGVLAGLDELWNMWLRARRTFGGLLRGVLEEVMGS